VSEVSRELLQCLHSEVGSGTSGLKRKRARSTESHGSEEPLTSETLLAVTAPTIVACWAVSLEGCKPSSADVSVNWPHTRPTRAGESTLKLTYAKRRCDARIKHGLAGTDKSIVPVWTYLSVRVAVTNKRRVVGCIQRPNNCYRVHCVEQGMVRTKTVSKTETYPEICPLASDDAPCHRAS
jgi:hypothetical protein